MNFSLGYKQCHQTCLKVNTWSDIFKNRHEKFFSHPFKNLIKAQERKKNSFFVFHYSLTVALDVKGNEFTDSLAVNTSCNLYNFRFLHCKIRLLIQIISKMLLLPFSILRFLHSSCKIMLSRSNKLD